MRERGLEPLWFNPLDPKNNHSKKQDHSQSPDSQWITLIVRALRVSRHLILRSKMIHYVQPDRHKMGINSTLKTLIRRLHMNQNTTQAMEQEFSTSDQDSTKFINYPVLFQKLANMLEDTVGYLALVKRTLNSEDFEEKVLSLQESPYYEELYLVKSFSKDACDQLAQARDMILRHI